MSITEFLLARISEDEEQAETCRKLGWFPADKYELHIVSYARVLAECAAKRAIVELHQLVTKSNYEQGPQEGCELCNWERDYGWDETGPCDTLRTLAAAYADHPEYLDEWRVGA